MAKVSYEIVETIRSAARKIENNKDYQWGHMGACNCGFLVQEVTHLNKGEIHNRAMIGHGDWSEQLNDYCSTSGLPLDDVVSSLLSFGFTIDDLKHLERLSDGKILGSLTPKERNLRYNSRADVVRYMHAWANQIEEKLIDQLKIDFQFSVEAVR